MLIARGRKKAPLPRSHSFASVPRQLREKKSHATEIGTAGKHQPRARKSGETEKSAMHKGSKNNSAQYQGACGNADLPFRTHHLDCAALNGQSGLIPRERTTLHHHGLRESLLGELFRGLLRARARATQKVYSLILGQITRIEEFLWREAIERNVPGRKRMHLRIFNRCANVQKRQFWLGLEQLMELSKCDRFHHTAIAPFGKLVKLCSNGIHLILGVLGGNGGIIRVAKVGPIVPFLGEESYFVPTARRASHGACKPCGPSNACIATSASSQEASRSSRGKCAIS